MHDPRLDNLLSEERGELRFHDVLEGEGERVLDKSFDEEFGVLKAKIGTCVVTSTDAKKRMGENTNRKRNLTISATYIKHMTKLLNSPDVHSLAVNDYKSIEGKIRDTGSELPRAILTYKFAFLYTMLEHSSSPLYQLVIDSPLQQDQDNENVRKILILLSRTHLVITS